VIASRQAGSPRFDQGSAVCVRRIAAKGDAFFAAAARELSKLPPDTVSFHSQWPSAASAQLQRGTGRTGKVFLAAHGRELLLEPWHASRVAQRAYDRTRARALVSADGVFPVSRYTAELAKSLGVSACNLHVEPGGVDPLRCCPGDDDNLRRTPNAAPVP
jgi:glycosyltransferase involved in cell wall biosynthesis